MEISDDAKRSLLEAIFDDNSREADLDGTDGLYTYYVNHDRYGPYLVVYWEAMVHSGDGEVSLAYRLVAIEPEGDE